MPMIQEQYERVKKEEAENKPTPKPFKLASLLKEIDDDKLVIPEFQRDFGWELDRFALLFDSIYKGYTIGNLLLWKVNLPLAHKVIGAERIKTIDQIDKGKEYTYVLDGQQRLTTLYGILRHKAISRRGQKPKLYKIYFDIQTDEFIKETFKIEDLGNRTIKKVIQDGDFDEFRFIDLSHIFNENFNFPDNLIKREEEENKRDLQNGTITQDEFFKIDKEIREKEELLKKFASVIKAYEIPQIIDYNEDIDKVVTVFERINTQNMQLDIFDIMVAKTYENILFNEKQYTFNLKRASDKLLYNKELNPDQLNPDMEMPNDKNLYYSIDRVTLLRLLSIFTNHDERIAMQKKDIYGLKAQTIQDQIIPFRKILVDIRNYTKNQLNINDLNVNYTNNNILSFLTYVFSEKPYSETNHDLINLWFWNTNVFNRFPGSQLEKIEKDLEAYNAGEDTFKRILKQRRDTSILNEEYTINKHKLIDAGYNNSSSRIYHAGILLLNSMKPVDFDGKLEIDLLSYIGINAKNNKHHIIPYNSEAGKRLREKYAGAKGEFVINNIANIAIISAEMNKKISKKSPKIYFENYEGGADFKKILQKHLIDETMYNDLINEKYEEFLIARTMKILELIKSKTSIDNEQLTFEITESDSEDDNGN